MKIAVIGASGKAGSRIAREARMRRHEVTAIVRDADKVAGCDCEVMTPKKKGMSRSIGRIATPAIGAP